MFTPTSMDQQGLHPSPLQPSGLDLNFYGALLGLGPAMASHSSNNLQLTPLHPDTLTSTCDVPAMDENMAEMKLFKRAEQCIIAAEIAALQAKPRSGLPAFFNYSSKKLPCPAKQPQTLVSNTIATTTEEQLPVRAVLSCVPAPEGDHRVQLNFLPPAAVVAAAQHAEHALPTLQDLITTKTNAAASTIRSLQARAVQHLDRTAFLAGGATADKALKSAVKAMAVDATTHVNNPMLQYYTMCTAAACNRNGGGVVTALRSRSSNTQLIVAGLAAVHLEAKKAWKAARAKAQRERLEALKSDDLEGYMRLIQNTKSSKIDKLLAQTDGCLRKLTDRLQRSAPALAAPIGTSDDAPINPASTNDDDGGDFMALQQSSEKWNTLAAAFNADIAEQPLLLVGGELREYQMRGLRWMVSLKTAGLNGILADEMGLGKTVQVIALVAHCLETSTSTAAAATAQHGTWAAPFLIAAPASVLPNWEKEFERWAPEIKVISYRGPAAHREEIFRREMRRVKVSGGRFEYKFHVVLTSYEYLMGKVDRPRLASVPWSYIIVDEGHRLKNSGCKLNGELSHYRAAHRLLLTGTPLQNGIDELWALLNFLMPDLFNSSEDFTTWFGGAMRRTPGIGTAAGTAAAPAVKNSENSIDSDDDDDDDEDDAQHAVMLSEEEMLIVTSRLHQVLRPFMLRRLKEAVAGELPAKVEHLVPCRPSPYQTALFSALQEQLQGPGGVRGVSNALMEARNICNHPLISKLHPAGVETTLPPHPLPSEIRLCGKLEVLDRILLKLKAAGHKILIFCTMTRLLDVLEGYLEWRGLGFLRLDGSTSSDDRGALVDEFNAPDSSAFVFLLSVRAGGVGLNLQAADTVIFYDTDWNPQMDAQAAARAHRIGQKREVLVLRLQTVGTVEERVTAVAAEKLGMADRSITGGFFDGKTSASERQRYLLGLLKAQDGGSSCGGGGGSTRGDLSNAELNRLLVRGEEELELFAKEDEKLAAAEAAAWKGKFSSSTTTTTTTATAFSRLALAEELDPLVAAVIEALTPVDVDAGREFGRGKRARGIDVYPK